MSRHGSVLPRGTKAPIASQTQGFALGALAIGVGLLALGYFILTAGRTSQPTPSSAQFAGPVFPPDLRAATFSLTDQNARQVKLAQFRGRVVVLTFMYSRSRDTSPLMATQIRGALDELPDGGRSEPVLAISLDPAHDTRASARAFLAREQMTGRMRFLSAPLGQLRPIWRRYAIQPAFDSSGRRHFGGASAYVMLIDRKGFLRVGFPAAQLVPEDLAHDVELLLDRPG